MVAGCASVPAPTLSPSSASPSSASPSPIAVDATEPASVPPTLQPTATAHATPSPTLPASPEPTATRKTGPGYDLVENLDPAAVSVVQVPDGTRVGSAAFCGQDAVYDDFDSTVENLLDFRTGAVTTIAGPEHGVKFGSPALSANWIAWASWRQKIDPNSDLLTEPIHWTISAVPAADPTATPIQVAAGTNVEPPAPDRPTLAIDGDLLAYTVESPQAGHPQAKAIIVHDLASGVDVERIQTEESVWALDLSGSNILYSEGTVDNDGFVIDTRVMLVVGNAAATETAPYGYEVAIDGDRLVWAQAATANASGLAIDQAIMTATVSDLEPVQLSRQSTDDQAYSGYLPAAGEGLVSWDDRAGGKLDDHIEVWDAVSGMKVPIFEAGSYPVSSICGGSIGWQGAVEAPPGSIFNAFYEAPVDAVKRLFQ